MPKDELEKHYLETTYSVFIDQDKYDIQVGEPVPAVINKLLENEKESSAVIVTAWNPRSELLSLQENQARNTKLKSKFKMHTIFDALGQGDDLSEQLWQAEESFFIIGLNKTDADKIAVEYGQYAYVWLENTKPVSLIFTRLWQLCRLDQGIT